MMRLCPKCETERPIYESFCEYLSGGVPCDWPLADVPIRPQGWRPARAEPGSSGTTVVCVEGHPMAEGDLICPTCGSDPSSARAEATAEGAGTARAETARTEAETAAEETLVAGWRLLRRLPTSSHVRERFETVHEADRREAVLTFYANGSEPDLEVYNTLRTLDHNHVSEILETGRWHDRAYEVSEDLRGGTLADLGLLPEGIGTLSAILREVGGALAALAECDLRHRDLRPGAIMVRSREPLDLVLTGFGSARLSQYDLDVVSPLEITRYTAPEAVAGGVAAASDWWGLGMVLLEQVTRGACFEGADDQSFLISVLTNGAPIPDGLDPRIEALLRGLLCVDRRTRWGWPEAQRWLAGEMPDAPPRLGAHGETGAGRSIEIGGRRFTRAERFALAAAEAQNWETARAMLLRGELATWIEEAGLHPDLRAEVRSIAAMTDVSEDIRLALALKALNPSMPLVVRGQIVTPGWLLDHPNEGYALITGPVPDRLERDEAEVWIARLKRREARVRERARQLEVELDEAQLRSAALSTSRTRLAAIWNERRRVLPDTDHPGLLAIVERRITEEEDLILLLAAAAGQFRAADAIVAEAQDAASRAGVTSFKEEEARRHLDLPRRELHGLIEGRLEGFARCGRDRIDEWGDQFRLERRLPLARAIALLAVPAGDWRPLPRQAYVATLLDFYARRITSSIMRGPLTRMTIGKTTARIDLATLDSPRRRAGSILDHLLLRNDQPIEIDAASLMDDPSVERRIRTLHAHATLYRRDTGIDGLYMGFPFLVMQEAKATTRPRIAPVLLWPVRLHPEVGARGRVTVAFDRDREEVRLNPALETLLGVEAAGRWFEAAKELLGRSSVTTTEAVDAFRELAAIQSRQLVPLPSKDLRVRVGEDRVVCAAALFHLGFLGQAVMEDLRQLKAMPPTGSSLETAFRVGEQVARAEPVRVAEAERYLTADSDPSQEDAVLEARAGRGLLVEGPPGTGKSQTIVNIVADAIGTGRNLLVVCQKQAALEVVHKRLEASGLGTRIVMVNDVNKDREPVIRAVREQLEELFQRPAGASGWRQQRQQTAARIEALERDLDGQHRALHAVDEQTGLSYRLILGDLIGLAREGMTLALPSLRQVLGTLDPGQVGVIQENCGPVARLWLPARYEGSPLTETRAFGTDEGSIATFRSDLEAFASTEHERQGIVERTPDAISIEDPEPYHAWTATDGGPLLRLDDAARLRVARWLDRLAGAGDRPCGQTSLQRALDATLRELLALPADDEPANAVEAARVMEDAALKEWAALSDRLNRRPSLLERLSLSRWTAGRRRRALMREKSLTDPLALGAALHREMGL